MLEKLDLILRVLDKGKAYLNPLLTFLVGLHFRQPAWMKKKEAAPEPKVEPKMEPKAEVKPTPKQEMKPVPGSKK